MNIKNGKLKLWFGFWGADSSGFLYTPDGKRVFWLPFHLNFKLKSFLERFSDIGESELTDAQIEEIKQIAKNTFKEELNNASNPDY